MPPAAPSTPAARDRAALIALYNATCGANWFNNDGWRDNASDLGTWRGVSLNQNGRVEQLQLVRNNPKGELPSDLANLTELRVLNMNSYMRTNKEIAGGRNALSGDIPDLSGFAS